MEDGGLSVDTQYDAKRRRKDNQLGDQFEDAEEDKVAGQRNDADGSRKKIVMTEEESQSSKKRKTMSNKTQDVEKFHCSVCGRNNFVTLLGASRHQRECDGTPNPEGPWTCCVCGKTGFATSQAFGGHWRCCNKGSCVTNSSISLRPEALETERARLSEFNQLLTDSLEFFEAGESDVKAQMVGNGRRVIKVGNIGIRCIPCARKGTMMAGSIAYTNDLSTLPHNMYTMVMRHLLNACQNTDTEVRKEMAVAKQLSTSQSMRKGALGLPAYLKLLIAHFQLTDYSKKDGVYRSNEMIGNPSQLEELQRITGACVDALYSAEVNVKAPEKKNHSSFRERDADNSPIPSMYVVL